MAHPEVDANWRTLDGAAAGTEAYRLTVAFGSHRFQPYDRLHESRSIFDCAV
jgi:hypothetical protein